MGVRSSVMSQRWLKLGSALIVQSLRNILFHLEMSMVPIEPKELRSLMKSVTRAEFGKKNFLHKGLFAKESTSRGILTTF